jgi:hypothetical protein
MSKKPYLSYSVFLRELFFVLKTKVARSSEASIDFQRTTLRYILEEEEIEKDMSK